MDIKISYANLSSSHDEIWSCLVEGLEIAKTTDAV